MSENISFNSAELGAPVETLGYEQARAELPAEERELLFGDEDACAAGLDARLDGHRSVAGRPGHGDNPYRGCGLW